MSIVLAERPSPELAFEPAPYLDAQIGFAEQPVIQPDVQLPPSFLATELPQEELVQQRFKKLAHEIGNIALGASQEQIEQKVSEATPEGQSSSLKDAIQRAAWGDKQARELITSNVAGDVAERTLKAGNVVTIKMTHDADGNIVQHGQDHGGIHKNSLLYDAAHPHMQKRSEAEARNSLRIKTYEQQGLLEDHYLVVLSRAPVASEMTEEEAKEAHFFIDTQSLAIQATTAEGDDIIVESGFVAGVKQPGGERHDEAATIGIGDNFEVDYRGMSTDQMIDSPMLIHKSLMPNGVVDLVKLSDAITGGFFGQDKPAQDYLLYKQFCEQRQANYAPKVEKVVNQLISEAFIIDTPLKATERLNKLSGAAMVEHAVYVDPTINPMVFGPEAAAHVVEARQAVAKGDTRQAQAAVDVAKKTEKSSSCPTANKLFGSEDKEKDEDGTDNKESKDGNIRCIKCRKVVKKKEVVKATSWCCPECKYEVDICNGKVLNKGEIPEEPKKIAKVIKLKHNLAPKTAGVAYNESEELSKVA